MSQDENLEGRILRDRIAEIGFTAGIVGGFVYGVITRDNEGASLIQSIGKGAIGGIVIAYGMGTLIKPIYEEVKRK